MKHAVIGAIFICACPLAFSLTCPSAEQIRHNQTAPWTLLDIDNDEPIHDERAQQFKQTVANFYAAEFLANVPYSGQCYYKVHGTPDYSLVSLGKMGLTEPKGEHWQKSDAAGTRERCESLNTNNCIF